MDIYIYIYIYILIKTSIVVLWVIKHIADGKKFRRNTLPPSLFIGRLIHLIV